MAIRIVVDLNNINGKSIYIKKKMVKEIREQINMVKNWSLKEDLNDSWTNGDKTFTLVQLLDVVKNIPTINIPVSKIKHLVLYNDNDNELQKSLNANLDYPILIIINDDNAMRCIIDGHHRLQKAIKLGHETIKCKLINFRDLPKDFQEILG